MSSELIKAAANAHLSLVEAEIAFNDAKNNLYRAEDAVRRARIEPNNYSVALNDSIITVKVNAPGRGGTFVEYLVSELLD